MYLKFQPIYLLLILPTIFLCACDKRDLPQYWICEGETFQQFTPYDGSNIKRYHGREKLLIENYGQGVNQYISKPFAGVYKVYKNTNQELIFESKASESDSTYQLGWCRWGILNKQTGHLYLSENGEKNDGGFVGVGSLKCKFLEHRFPASVFY